MAVFTQVTDYVGGDYNFNLRGVLEMSQKVPGVHDYMPPMIGSLPLLNPRWNTGFLWFHKLGMQ